MKNLLKLVAFFGAAILLCTCTADSEDDFLIVNENNPCVDEDPITRVVNNGTTAFDLNVLALDGTIVVTIVNIPPNTTTSWASFTEGEVLFSVTNSEPMVSDEKVQLQMDNCMAFEIEIGSNNEIISYIPTIL